MRTTPSTRIPASDEKQIVFWRTFGNDWESLGWSSIQIRRAGSSSAVCRTKPETGFSSGPDWRACARSPSNPDKRGDQCGPYDFEQGGRDLRY
jgi:hypothetical protein